MSRRFKLFLLALLGGLALRWATHPLGLKLRLWQRAWSERYGPVEGRKLAARVRRRYDALRADCPYQPNPVLRWHLDDQILPGLALYQVLKNELAGPAAAESAAAGTAASRTLQETARLFKAASSPFNLPMRFLQGLPNPFPVFRWAVKRRVAQGFPPAGWDFTPVADSPQRLAFDARRCFYLDTLRRYGAPELTPLFCQLDDWMMAGLPPTIEWRRSGTLAHGAAACSFDWCKTG